MTAKKVYSLTDEHRKKLPAWRDKWIANAMSTKPMSERERLQCRKAVLGLYEAAKLLPPVNVVFAPGPISGAFAAGIAAGIWYLREHPEKHVVMFGRAMSELDLVALIAPACREAFGLERFQATDQATCQATDQATRQATQFLLSCPDQSWHMRDGGNQWSGWSACISFSRHVAKLPIDYSRWQHYEMLAFHSGPRYMHAKFAIVCDRPTVLKVDERNRPHCADGPSHMWADGVALHYWHGVRVPARLVEHAETYTADEVRSETNSEIVRALAEHLGWDKFLEMMGAKSIDCWTDPVTGLAYELLEVQHRLSDGQPRFLRMQSPPLRDKTQPHYVEPVHPDLETAQAARRWQIANGDGTWQTVEQCNNNPVLEFSEEV